VPRRLHWPKGKRQHERGLSPTVKSDGHICCEANPRYNFGTCSSTGQPPYCELVEVSTEELSHVGFDAVDFIELGSKAPKSHASAALPSCNTTSGVVMRLRRRTSY
jgi:hypothetical protein